MSRVLVAYSLSASGDAETLGDYQDIFVKIGSDEESTGRTGEEE